MHAQEIVHRDMKLENILINQEGAIKIIDFGFATRCKEHQKLDYMVGTPHYMDPDLARKAPCNGWGADIWALGVILFTLLTAKLPFFGEFEEDLFRRIISGKYTYPIDVH